jgi:PKD domain
MKKTFCIVFPLIAFLFITMPSTSFADTQNFTASNVTWDGTTLNFDTNVDMSTVPSADPGPYHDLYIFNISSPDGNYGYWSTTGTDNISCTATHCTITNLTNNNEGNGFYSDNGVSQVQFSIYDGNDEFVGQSQSDVPWTPVATPNPLVGAIQGATINEGDTYTESGSFTDPDSTSWTATVDYGEGGGEQPLTLNPDNTFSLSHTYQDQGTYTVTVRVTDNQGNTGKAIATVTVKSLPVTINTISVSAPIIRVNSGTAAFASYTYSGVNDRHTATWDWGDGTHSSGSIRESNGSGTVGTDPHTYTSIGTYTITLTIKGADGVIQTATTTVKVKTEPSDFGNAYMVQGSATMTSDHILTFQLADMPTDAYNGIEVCDYLTDETTCDTDFIVGSGGITYTISDGQYTGATIDIDPSVFGEGVALGVYPLDKDNEFVGDPGDASHTTVTLTNAPLTVTGITTSGDKTIVSVGGYTLSKQNAYYCTITGTTDNTSSDVWYGNGPEGSSPDILSSSCSFPTSEINAIRSTNASFYLEIDDLFDSTVVTTQNYNFSQLPQTTILTPIADTYIKSGKPNENEGTSTFLRLQNIGDNRALVKFDTSQIQDAVGDSQNYTATLQFTITDNGNNWGAQGRTIDVHRMLQDWAEGNGFITDNPTAPDQGTGTGSTWNCASDSNISNEQLNCSGATAWDMTDNGSWPFSATPTATTTITNNQDGTVSFDVTSDVQSIIAGTNPNDGWLIKKTNEGIGGLVEFGSKESGNSPELIITPQ